MLQLVNENWWLLHHMIAANDLFSFLQHTVVTATTRASWYQNLMERILEVGWLSFGGWADYLAMWASWFWPSTTTVSSPYWATFQAAQGHCDAYRKKKWQLTDDDIVLDCWLLLMVVAELAELGFPPQMSKLSCHWPLTSYVTQREREMWIFQCVIIYCCFWMSVADITSCLDLVANIILLLFQIPGGTMEDSKVLKGILINKDVTHPKMRR